MIGALEIVVIVALVLIFFGYRYLPALGRRAGSGLRRVGKGAEKHADTLTDSAKGAIGDRFDPSEIGRQAGRGLREVREVRDAVTGREPEPAAKQSEPAAKPAREDGSSPDDA